MTPRLYHDDPLLLRFEATLVAHDRYASTQGPAEGRAPWPSLVLSQTAFYPEAGGQMADRGEIEVGGVRLRVLDVQADDAGVVHHRIEPIDATLDVEAIVPGSTITGVIDRARRRVHMALHTGQHMLSRALLDEAAAPTVSARLGETACTIDVERESLEDRLAARAEDLVNDVIDDDRSVRAYFPTPEELARLELRRAPKVSTRVRVVDVDGFDVTPCGGTHCVRTGQVGLVKIVATERYKGKTRITFVAGKRARSTFAAAHSAIGTVATRLSTSPDHAIEILDKLQADFGVERDRSRGLARDLADRVAGELVRSAEERGQSIVVGVVPGATTEILRPIAARITKRPGAVALLAGDDGAGRPVVFARGNLVGGAPAVDCGGLLKTIAAACGGRGGGRPERAEGRIPIEADLVALVNAALSDVVVGGGTRAPERA